MHDVDALRGLLERVRAAAGPDRLTDAHLVCHLLAPSESFVTVAPITKEIRVCVGRGSFTGADLVWADWRGRHFVTRDIDAAVALAEAVLPGASIEVTIGAPKEARRISTAFIRRGDHDLGECWEAATGPLALCAALCSALIAQVDGGQHV